MFDLHTCWHCSRCKNRVWYHFNFSRLDNNISWYEEACTYILNKFRNFRKCSICFIFYHVCTVFEIRVVWLLDCFYLEHPTPTSNRNGCEAWAETRPEAPCTNIGHGWGEKHSSPERKQNRKTLFFIKKRNNNAWISKKNAITKENEFPENECVNIKRIPEGNREAYNLVFT